MLKRFHHSYLITNLILTWKTSPLVGLSTIVIALTMSIAFSIWMQSLVRLVFYVPLVIFLENSGVYDWWKSTSINTEGLKERNNRVDKRISRHREESQGEKKVPEEIDCTGKGKRLESENVVKGPSADQHDHVQSVGNRTAIYRMILDDLPIFRRRPTSDQNPA